MANTGKTHFHTGGPNTTVALKIMKTNRPCRITRYAGESGRRSTQARQQTPISASHSRLKT